MRFISFLLFLLFVSCKSQDINSKQLIKQKEIYTFQNNCPENGICSIETIPNSELEIKQDEFGNLYPELKKGIKLVLKYEFKKTPIVNTADSNYSEIIYFEIDNHKNKLDLHDKELQEVKMLFGRLCYCKGATGYYKIDNGNLKMEINQKLITVNLQFEVKKIPQIIQSINETVKLN